MDWPGMEPVLRGERPATDRLNQGTVRRFSYFKGMNTNTACNCLYTEGLYLEDIRKKPTGLHSIVTLKTNCNKPFRDNIKLNDI